VGPFQLRDDRRVFLQLFLRARLSLVLVESGVEFVPFLIDGQDKPKWFTDAYEAAETPSMLGTPGGFAPGGGEGDPNSWAGDSKARPVSRRPVPARPRSVSRWSPRDRVRAGRADPRGRTLSPGVCFSPPRVGPTLPIIHALDAFRLLRLMPLNSAPTSIASR
jgi:hypothetical protein